MPRYDYACRNCGHVVEVMHGVNDSGPGQCDRCGGPMRKLMSRPAIVFKGSGWAKNDARTAQSSGAAKSATKTEADARPAASEPAKTDKPAAGAEPAKSTDSNAGGKAGTSAGSASDS